MADPKATVGDGRKRILYVQYTNPAGYPPLEHSSRILADRGWEVLLLGIGAFGSDSLRFRNHIGVTVKRLASHSSGWRQKLHYLQYALWVSLHIFHFRPHWIYVSDTLACPLGLVFSYFPRMNIVYHEHDSPGPGFGSQVLRLCLGARCRLAKRAKLCVLPNEVRAARFQSELKPRCPVECVWNCPELGEAVLPHIGGKPGEFRILFHGSLSPARLPETVVYALALLPTGSKLRIIGYETIGFTGYVRSLQDLACQLGISDRIEWLGPLATRDELLARARECDVGLALMPLVSSDINLQFMAGASNKPFDYLACGLALLVSDLPQWHELYVQPGYGLACNPGNAASIAGKLRWYFDNPAAVQAMGEKGRNRIVSEWNFETGFSPVVRDLETTRVGP